MDETVVSYAGGGTAARGWLLTDERGSVIAAADSSGAASAINTYDPFGVPAAGNSGRFQYTGQAWIPEAGVYHYKARDYAPALGRFLQTDPVGYKSNFNLYAYARNDPVNHADPTGKWPDWDDVATFLDTVGDVLQANPEIGGPIEAPAARFLASGAEALAEGAEAAKAARAAQLAKNVVQGAEGEAKTAAKLGDKVAGKQITFKTADGTRTRPDFVTKDKGVVDTKTGGAQPTAGQQKLHDDIAAERQVTPVGKNAEAAGLKPGEPTTMKSCEFDRPC